MMYKHGILGDEDAAEYMINSIQECKYVSPFQLERLFYIYEYVFAEELDKLDKEEWYKLEIHENSHMKFVLDKVTKIVCDKDTDEFLLLH